MNFRFSFVLKLHVSFFFSCRDMWIDFFAIFYSDRDENLLVISALECRD